MQSEIGIRTRLKSILDNLPDTPDEAGQSIVSQIAALVWVLDKNLSWSAAGGKATEHWENRHK